MAPNSENCAEVSAARSALALATGDDLEELETLHAEGQRGRLLRDFLIGVLLMQVRV